MVDYEIKYSYKDISIVPVRYSRVAHRSECNPEGVLPIFTAPMTSVVGINSVPAYESCGITPILPRPTDSKIRLDNLGWSAYGLEEFKTYFCTDKLAGINKKALIDIANGHMALLFDLVQEAKKKHPDLTIMIGNIANPETIVEADSAGADYVRLGIGAGDGCITTSNTGIHYPMASLISEASGAKNLYRLKIKLVADGGIRGYADVIKALALGADYVMIGGLFSQCVESEGTWYEYNNLEENYYPVLREEVSDPLCGKYYKGFYGMASKYGQIDMCGKKYKTSEGIMKYKPLKYTLSGWAENMLAYLRSAMSYLDVTKVEDIKNNARCVICSLGTQQSINI